MEHDGHVGQLLSKLEQLGIANNTIVIYTTDNGAEVFSWPDGGTTPFRGEKNTNWEGGYRVPALIRWPGKIAPHTEINDIVSAEDWVPTLMAAAGRADITSKLLQGYDAGDKNFKVHLDGYDQGDLLAGKGPDPRREFFYWTDDGDLAGLRYDRWKAVFMEQRTEGLDVWREPSGGTARAAAVRSARQTRSSGRSTKLATTSAGLSIGCSCWRPRRRSSADTCNRSGISRRGRRLVRSQSVDALQSLRTGATSDN